MEDDLAKKELDLTPRIAACRRKADNYDAELIFNHVHYVVGVGCASHELALAAANKACVKLKKLLRNAGARFVAPYPTAKP